MLDLALIAPEKPHPVDRAIYDTLIEAGALENDHVELLHGVVIERSPQGDAHAWTVRRLTGLLGELLRRRADLLVQAPFDAGEDSQPEPDLALVEAELGPTERPSRAYLVVEVAGTSLRKDRAVKGPLYARAGAPEYWVVDLEHRRVERYRDPAPEGYRTMTTHERSETLTLVAFPDITLSLADFVP